MKKILFILIFLVGLVSTADAAYKAVPKELHDQDDVVLDYYEAAAASATTGTDLSLSQHLTVEKAMMVDNGTLYVDPVNNRVGIGVTTPGVTLDVVDSDSSVSNSQFTIQNTNSAGVTMQKIQNNLGTASEFRLGQFGSTASGTLFGESIANYSMFRALGASTNGILFGASTSDPIIFGTNDTKRMTIESDGDIAMDTDTLFVDASADRVGIGTATPDNALHVVSSSFPTTKIERTTSVTSSVASGMVLKTTSSGSTNAGFGGGFLFRMQDSSGSEASLGGVFGLRESSDDTGSLSFQPSVSGTLTERMRILANGNVGIGTTSPQATLDVSGNVSMSNNLSVDGKMFADVDADGITDDVFAVINSKTNYFALDGTGIVTGSGLDDLTVVGNMIVQGSLDVGSLAGTNMELVGSVDAGRSLTASGSSWISPNVWTFSGNTTLAANQVRNSVISVTGASTQTLPAVAAGYNLVIETVGNIAVAVDPNASDKLYLNGTALDDGDKAWNLTTSGNLFILRAYPNTSPDGWMLSCNGCTDGGA